MCVGLDPPNDCAVVSGVLGVVELSPATLHAPIKPAGMTTSYIFFFDIYGQKITDKPGRHIDDLKIG